MTARKRLTSIVMPIKDIVVFLIIFGAVSWLLGGGVLASSIGRGLVSNLVVGTTENHAVPVIGIVSSMVVITGGGGGGGGGGITSSTFESTASIELLYLLNVAIPTPGIENAINSIANCSAVGNLNS